MSPYLPSRDYIAPGATQTTPNPKENKPMQGLICVFLAEAVRFELTNGSHRRQFSRLVPSTARPRFLSSVIIPKSLSRGGKPDRVAAVCAKNSAACRMVGAAYGFDAQFSRKMCSNSAAGKGRESR